MMPLGEELDLLVAKALGRAPKHLPWFSVETSSIPEMLAWLRKTGTVELYVDEDGVEGKHRVQVCRFEADKVPAKVRRCETLQHALANLVVAVAARTAAKEAT